MKRLRIRTATIRTTCRVTPPSYYYCKNYKKNSVNDIVALKRCYVSDGSENFPKDLLDKVAERRRRREERENETQQQGNRGDDVGIFELNQLEDTIAGESQGKNIFRSGAVKESGETRRFYRKVTVEKSEEEEGYTVKLDTRSILTPKGKKVVVPWEVMAYMIAAEWEGQNDFILPYSMPMMTMATTVIDRVKFGRVHIRQDIVMSMVQALHSDTLLLPDPDYTDLGKRQKEQWSPLVTWFTREFYVPLHVHVGVSQKIQAKETIHAIELFLRSLNDWELVGLDVITARTKSLVLGLAVLKSRLTVEEALRMSQIEEDFQSEMNGFVEGHHDIQWIETLKTAASASVLIKLTQGAKDKMNL